MVIWKDGVVVAGDGGSHPQQASFGAFTTAGCDRCRPLLWERHRVRLGATLSELDPELEAVLPSEREMAGLLSAAGLPGPARLRLVATHAGAAWSLQASVAEELEAGTERAPLQLDVMRWPAVPPLAGHKTLARLAWDLAARRARARGADDAVLVDSTGRVLETSVANVWARFATRVLTPSAPACCLPGVMRGWLVQHLDRAGLHVEEGDLQLEGLLEADEVWISNAVVGVRRVARVGTATWSAWPAFRELAVIAVPAPGWPELGKVPSVKQPRP